MAKSTDKKKRRMMFEFVQESQVFKMNGVPFVKIGNMTLEDGAVVNAINMINNQSIFVEDIVYVQPTSATY